MNKTQQKVLDALSGKSSTITQLEAAGVSRSTVRDAVAALLAAGQVEDFGISCDDARVYALTGYTAAWRRQNADFYRHEIGHYWEQVA